MRDRRLRIAVLVCLTVVTLFLGAAESRFVLPAETARFKPGEGADLANAQCLICHSADYITTQPRLSRAAWKASVQKMQKTYGAPIPPDKVDALVDYLVRNYGMEAPTR